MIAQAPLSAAPPAPPFPQPDYMASLNAPQHEAILATEGPLLVLAGAGTGKTRTLTARLAHLVATGKAWPSQILCVTFTNKAAKEMRERVSKLIGDSSEQLPWLGTFHAISAKILRRHADLLGLTSSFTILDTDDQLRLLKQLIEAAGLDSKRWTPRALAASIDRWKNRGWRPVDVPASDAGDWGDGCAPRLYGVYQERLKTLNSCDFGDLLLHTVRLFLDHPAILASYHERFRYIMVDEYQDTNVAQYLWLRLLAQHRRNICCVGDDDQSIYSWRGAEVANILRFEEDFPGAKIIRLEENYRSTPDILAAAAAMIASNEGRFGKTLWTSSPPDGEKVRIVSVWDGAEEARWVCDHIDRLRQSGHALGTMAILVRAGFQTREFEDRFLATGMAYRIVSGQRFYERAEIRDALAYLRLIAQPADDLALERIINTPPRGIGPKTVQLLHSAARTDAVPLSAAARILVDREDIPTAARRTLTAFTADLDRWRAQMLTLPQGDLMRLVLDESGITAHWQAENTLEARGRLDNLQELVRAMDEFDSLAGFLEHISLVMDHENNSSDQQVTVMTLHAAKGLEFNTVFLAGWEDGVLPNQRALDEQGHAALEEERRLAYVGLTRARQRAIILHAANRRIYGQWQACTPSRFLEELAENHVVRESTLSQGTSSWQAAVARDAKERTHTARSPAADPFASVNDSLSVQRAKARQSTPRMIAPSAAPTRARPALKNPFQKGDTVSHAKFGTGIVTATQDNKLTINFTTAGEKQVLASFIKPL